MTARSGAVPGARRVRQWLSAHRRVLAEAALIAAMALAESVAWTPGGALPWGGDVTPLLRPDQYLTHTSSAWNWWVGMGSGSPSVVSDRPIAVVLFQGGLTGAGIPFVVVDRVYLAVMLTAAALSVRYLAPVLAGTDRHREGLIAGVLLLGSTYWILQGNPDIETLAYTTAAISFTLASLAWAIRSPAPLAPIAPAFGFALLFSAVPFSIPRLALVIVGALGLGWYLVVWERYPLATGLRMTRTSLVAILLGLSMCAYLAVVVPLSGAAYGAELQQVGSYFPTTGFKALSDVPLNVVSMRNDWGAYSSAYATSNATYYLASPFGILSTFCLPILAFGSLLRRPGPTMGSRIRVPLAGILLLILLGQTGTTIPLLASFWRPLVSSPDGSALFAAAISLSFSPFLAMGYVVLAAGTVGELIERAQRGTPGPGGSTAPAPDPAPRHRAVARRIDGRNWAAGALILVGLLLVAGAVPVATGGVDVWRADTPQQTGVTVPPQYAGLDAWLAGEESPPTNVLTLPTAGQWPTLGNADQPWYSGWNPYPDLLPASPVIDGTTETLKAGGYGVGAQLVTTAATSLQSPSVLAPLAEGSLPTWSLDHQTTATPNSSAAWAELGCWSSCGASIGLVSTPRLPGSDGSFELRLAASGPAGAATVLSLRPPTPLDPDTNVVIVFWIDGTLGPPAIPWVDLSDSLGNSGYVNGSVATSNGNFTGYWVDFPAGSAPPSGANATLRFAWPGRALTGPADVVFGGVDCGTDGLARGAANLAGSLVEWHPINDGADLLGWDPNDSLPGEMGSFEATASPSFPPTGSPASNLRGAYWQPVSPVNLSAAGTLGLWVNLTGLDPAQLFVALGYGAGFSVYLHVPDQLGLGVPVTVGPWTLLSFPLDAVPPPVLSNLSSLWIAYYPGSGAGPETLRIGYVGFFDSDLTNSSLALGLLQMIGAGIVVADPSVETSTAQIAAVTNLSRSVPALRIGFQQGGLLAYQDSQNVSELGWVSVVSPADSWTQVLAVAANATDLRPTGFCWAGGSCPSVAGTSQGSSGLVRSAVDLSDDSATGTVVGPGVLILHQVYSTGWALDVNGTRIPDRVIDGFENGWWIPNGTETFSLRFLAEATFAVLATLSIAVIVALAALFLIGWTAPSVLPRLLRPPPRRP